MDKPAEHLGIYLVEWDRGPYACCAVTIARSPEHAEEMLILHKSCKVSAIAHIGTADPFQHCRVLCEEVP